MIEENELKYMNERLQVYIVLEASVFVSEKEYDRRS